MCIVQEHLKFKSRLGCHWRVCIQAVGYAFKISSVLIQDVDPSVALSGQQTLVESNASRM